MTDAARSLVVERTFAAPPARVFEAWRDPAIMTLWFSPPGWAAEITSEFVVGGKYRIEMVGPEGPGHVQHGEYVEIRPDERLVFTWSCHQLGVDGSRVTVDFAPRDDGTKLTITHELLPEGEVRAMHEEGWNRCLDQLDPVVAERTEEER